VIRIRSEYAVEPLFVENVNLLGTEFVEIALSTSLEIAVAFIKEVPSGGLVIIGPIPGPLLYAV